MEAFGRAPGAWLRDEIDKSRRFQYEFGIRDSDTIIRHVMGRD